MNTELTHCCDFISKVLKKQVIDHSLDAEEADALEDVLVQVVFFIIGLRAKFVNGEATERHIITYGRFVYEGIKRDTILPEWLVTRCLIELELADIAQTVNSKQKQLWNRIAAALELDDEDRKKKNRS